MGESSRKFLFVLCPPFSGSSLFYRLLETSPQVSTLSGHGNWEGEGQFIPSVKGLMRPQRWNPDAKFQWDQIKREWDKCWDLSKPILVEKSPPHLVRAFDIQDYFGKFGEVFFLLGVRNPYFVRQGPSAWITQAQYQRQNLGLKHALMVSYEHLLEDPERVKSQLLEFLPDLQSLDLEIETVDRAAQQDGLFKLGSSDRFQRITKSLALNRSEKLASHESIVKDFGYHIWTEADCSHRAWEPELEVSININLDGRQEHRLVSAFGPSLGEWIRTAETEGSVVQEGLGGARRFFLFMRPFNYSVGVEVVDVGPRRLTWKWSNFISEVQGPWDQEVSEVTVSWSPVGENVFQISITHQVLPRYYMRVLKGFWEQALLRLQAFMASEAVG